MNNSKIRIIKKKDSSQIDAKSRTEENQEAASERKIMRTVAEWARDLQERRQEESKLAFERFFPKSAQIGTV